MPFSISRCKILSIALLMKLLLYAFKLHSICLSIHATIRMQLSTCVAAISSPIKEKNDWKQKNRSFASFGKGRREAPWNPNAHLTYNFSTF
jgi:hypothetical protein